MPRHGFFFELLTCFLGLSALPFALFKLPGLGQLMLRMRPTGYDAAGGLRLKLSIRRMKKKWEAEQDLVRKQSKRQARLRQLADKQAAKQDSKLVGAKLRQLL